MFVKAEIIVVGMLSDPVFIRRQKHCRRVLSTEGVCVCIPAGCGTGGGITPKIIETYED